MEALTHTAEEELLAAWFQQADSAWLAGVRLALGGQPIEAQTQLRSALEYSAYTLHFTRNQSLQEVWLRRHDSESGRIASRNAFSAASVKGTLGRESADLAQRFGDLYEQTIDFGAHPNERALTSRLSLRSEDGVTASSVTQLTDNPADYQVAAYTIRRVGALCLAVFNRIFTTKFQLASLDVEIERLLRNA